MRKVLSVFAVFILLATSTELIAQTDFDFEKLSAPFKAPKRSKIMILGTFHYRDAGLDSYKPKFSVNIKSEKRQAEVQALLKMLAQFKPTKVAIENMQKYQGFHDSLYTEFINKRYEPGENEIYQVCYRLAHMMGHTKVYTVDAPARFYSPSLNRDSFATKNHQAYLFDETYNPLYQSLYNIEDSIKSFTPLKKIYQYYNDPARLYLGMGHYITGGFKLAANGDYPGADGATGWFNRNLRIFSNLMQLAASSDEERVFLMIGAGHLPILRFLALSTPEIEFVDVRDYLK